MRTTVRLLAFVLAAVLAAAPAAHAQTPTPAVPGTPGSTPASQDSMRGGMMRDSARSAAQDTMRHGGMGPGAARRGGAADSSLVARLDSVDTAAKAGLTNLPAATAVSLIESIETRLQASGRPALRSIARDLGALRAELGASTVDGRKVGVILRRLGPKVTTVARTQSGAVRTTLQSIGSQLTTAGGQLVAGAAG